MKFSCDGMDLARALTKMLKVVPKGKAALAVFLKLIATITGELLLRVRYEGVTVTTEIPAYVDAIGSVSLLPGRLTDLVRAVASESRGVSFEHHSALQQLEVIARTMEQRLPTVEDEESPPTTSDLGDVGNSVHVTAGAFKVALDRLAPVQQDAQGFGTIDDMSFDVDPENRVTLVATDSVRLAMVGLPEASVSSPASPQKSWSLRNRDVLLLRSLLNGNTATEESVNIQFGQGVWSANWGTYRMTAPLSEKEFPRWRSIRPHSFTNALTTDAKELSGILKLLGKLGDDKRATVRFKWNGATEAALSAGSRILGTETVISLALQWDYREAAAGSELALNARLVEPLVKRLGPGTVQFCFTSPAMPAMVRPAGGGEGLEYLVMPINL